MPNLRFHLISKDHDEDEIKTIMEKLEVEKEIEGVRQSKEMGIPGISEIVIGIRVVELTLDLVRKLRGYLRRNDYLEFKCGGKKVKIEGKMNSEEVKTVYNTLCGE